MTPIEVRSLLSPHLQQQREVLAQTTLQNELYKDMRRIWARNLGRDDRALSFWGKEARHPFLDEDFVSFIGRFIPSKDVDRANEEYVRNRQVAERNNDSTPPAFFSIDQLANFDLPPGIGDKKLLRDIAVSLGLDVSGRLMKRAMQFGTKIVNKQLVGTQEMNEQVELETILNQSVLKGSSK